VAKKARNFLISGLLFAALSMVAYADSVVTVFSSGYMAPETITPVPAGFGTSGGTLLVPDKIANALYTMPADGGAPTLFANGVGGNGGAFLPSSFGAFGGDYLATANIGGPQIVAVNGTGGQTTITVPSTDFATGGAVVAPAGLGSVAGDALIGAKNGRF
jgi:hypothetical protein